MARLKKSMTLFMALLFVLSNQLVYAENSVDSIDQESIETNVEVETETVDITSSQASGDFVVQSDSSDEIVSEGIESKDIVSDIVTKTAATSDTENEIEDEAGTGISNETVNVAEDTVVDDNSLHTVSFIDSLTGETISVVSVSDQGAAESPEIPTHDGYEFKGYNTDFSCVTEDLVVTLLYEEIIEEDLNFVELALTETIDSYVITVEGEMPEGTSLVVSKVDNTNAEEAINSLDSVSNFEAEVTFDIKLICDDVEYQPTDYDKSVTVKIEGIDSSKELSVYRVTDEGSVTDMSAFTIEDEVSFETDHFTEYTIGSETDNSILLASYNGVDYYDTDAYSYTEVAGLLIYLYEDGFCYIGGDVTTSISYSNLIYMPWNGAYTGSTSYPIQIVYANFTNSGNYSLYRLFQSSCGDKFIGGPDIQLGTCRLYNDFFAYSDFSYIDMSNIDFSYATSVYSMFTGVDNLEVLITPKKTGYSDGSPAWLPYIMYDSEDNAYTSMPWKLESPITLTKTRPNKLLATYNGKEYWRADASETVAYLGLDVYIYDDDFCYIGGTQTSSTTASKTKKSPWYKNSNITVLYLDYDTDGQSQNYLFYGATYVTDVITGENYNSIDTIFYRQMFKNMTSLENVDLYYMYGSAADISRMFCNCPKLTEVTLYFSYYCPSCDLSGLFKDCTSLQYVSNIESPALAEYLSTLTPISDEDIAIEIPSELSEYYANNYCGDVSYLLYNCPELVGVDLDIRINDSTNCDYIFSNSSKLHIINFNDITLKDIATNILSTTGDISDWYTLNEEEIVELNSLESWNSNGIFVRPSTHTYISSSHASYTYILDGHDICSKCPKETASNASNDELEETLINKESESTTDMNTSSVESSVQSSSSLTTTSSSASSSVDSTLLDEALIDSVLDIASEEETSNSSSNSNTKEKLSITNNDIYSGADNDSDVADGSTKTLTITGYVSINNQPQSNVTVVAIINNNRYSGITDDTGYYEIITNEPVGSSSGTITAYSEDGEALVIRTFTDENPPRGILKISLSKEDEIDAEDNNNSNNSVISALRKWWPWILLIILIIVSIIEYRKYKKYRRNE